MYGRTTQSLKPSQNAAQGDKVDVQALVENSRADVAKANPVSFLIRLMNGEEIEGKSVSLKERMAIAMYLGNKQLANLQATELTGKDGKDLVPAPLIIQLANAISVNNATDNPPALDVDINQ